MNRDLNTRPAARQVTSLSALWPFAARYRLQITLAALFLAVSAAGALAIPLAVGQVIDRGFLAEDLSRIDRWFWLLFAAAAVMAVGGGLRFYWVSWLGQRVIADIRAAVYQRVIMMSPAFFDRTRTGEVLSRLNTDTTLVETLVGSTASFAIRNLVMLIASAVALALTAPSLAGVIALLIGMIIVPVLIIGRWVRRLSRRAQDRLADFTALGDESINAVQTVQALGQEAREVGRFRGAVEEAFRAGRRRIAASTVLIVLIILLTFGAITFVLWLGARAVLAGNMSPGQLGQFVLYAAIAAGATAGLSEVWSQVQRAAGAMERLAELLALKSQIVAPDDPVPAPAAAPKIRFDRLGFVYPARPDQPVLEEFELTVGAGETLALVGPSGAGKSTLFQLLMRFYDPDQGRILLDGVDIRQMDPQALRARIGLVPQNVVLFSGTVADNIRYGAPDATDEEVMEAARAAYATEFISRWPQGFETRIGERGLSLSGGQRQRLAIARALIRNPVLLLLDEATASLDAESEAHVQTAISRAARDRTVLVIAHRLATVRRVDRIVVVEGGRLVAEGHHDRLIEDSELYARLARLQFVQNG